MKEERSAILANRFKEVLLDGDWIANTNYQKQLADIAFEQANQKVVDLNTIAILTFHINYYLVGLNHFFETGELTIKDKHSFEAPALKNEAYWEKLKQDLFTNAEQFTEHVMKLSDDDLDQFF